MPRLTPQNYKKLVGVFEKLGFIFDRQEGDHLVYVKSGIRRPIVIPMYKDVPVFIILNNIRSAEITREQFLKLIKSI